MRCGKCGWLTGPLPAKELVDKLMTEEDRPVTTKDSRVAEVASPSTPSPAPVPWSAEEQKVELILIY